MTTHCWCDKITANLSPISTNPKDLTMRRTVSQPKILTPNDKTISSKPKNTEVALKKEPASWGWFVNGDCTPPTEAFPRPSPRSRPQRRPRPGKQQTQPHPQTGTIKQNKATADRNLSNSEFMLINCLACCHTIFRQSILSLTGIHQKLEPLKKEIDSHKEPETALICRN